MKNNIQLILLPLIASCLFAPLSLAAPTIKGSIAIIPVHSTLGMDGRPQGGIVDVVHAINSASPEANISISQSPFQRSISSVVNGANDFHIPLIRTPTTDIDRLPFSYADECFTKVTFVLYSRADKAPIDMNNIEKYVIETQRGHKDLFPFEVTEVNTITQGIGKVLRGRIDGYVMEQDAVDHVIQDNHITNIRRSLFAVWDACIIISKGKRQHELNKVLSTALRALKKTDAFQALLKTIHQPYREWQPYKMDW